jgi:CspA family cold shock protein
MLIKKTGRIKWFDFTRGFGFLVPDDGSPDVFVHELTLKQDGFNQIGPGAVVEALAFKAANGAWRAKRILSVDLSQVQTTALPRCEGQTAWLRGKVKFLSPDGWGFVICPKPWGDVFFHMEDMRRCGIPSLRPDEEIMVRCGYGKRGAAVADMRPVDEYAKVE